MYSYIIEASGNRVGWVDGIHNEQRRFAIRELSVCWSRVVVQRFIPYPPLLCSALYLQPLASADLLAGFFAAGSLLDS